MRIVARSRSSSKNAGTTRVIFPEFDVVLYVFYSVDHTKNIDRRRPDLTLLHDKNHSFVFSKHPPFILKFYILMHVSHFHFYVTLFLLLLIPGISQADKPAYLIYDQEGNPAVFSEMAERATRADVIFFGELHNNAIAHWMQVELVKHLIGAKNGLILGLEMFERDDQILIEEYLAGLMTSETFAREAKLWPNYRTDIRPLVQLAKEHNFPIIATNVPRRYANLVYRHGLDTLTHISTQGLSYMAPLPFEINRELETYRNIAQAAHGHGGQNFFLLESQALKDATMAHFLIQNRQAGIPFLHINGSYHSLQKEGMVWFVAQARPDWEILTISVVEQNDITELSEANHGAADYLIVVPSTMTRTH